MRPASGSILAAALLAFGAIALAQPVEPVLAQARANRQPLLDTLKEVVQIESGSRDKEGLDKLSELIAGKLRALGGDVRFIEASDVYKMEDTPEQIGRMVHATFKGKGAKKIMLIAHMDTVYVKGMYEKQPFRVEGDKAYGLGHRRRQAGHRDHHPRREDAEGPRLQRLRHAHRAHQRRRGDQLAGLARHHHAHGRGARRHALLRGLARRIGQDLARDRGHRVGHAHREGARLARRLRAAPRHQLALRAVAPDPADQGPRPTRRPASR
jgi:hypothetical protein